MRFKKGNRWKSSKSEVRYKSWRKSVFELNRAKRGLRKWYVCEKCNKPFYSDTNDASKCKDGSKETCPDNSQKDKDGSCKCNTGYSGELKWDRLTGEWTGRCEGFKGECENGESIELEKRTADNQCSSCEDGYYLNSFGDCA